MKKALPFLSDILDETKGAIPHARTWKNQFHAFLIENKINWSPKDIDTPIDNLRIMLQSLKKFKNPRNTLPRNHSMLTILVEKLARTENPDDDDDDDDDMVDDGVNIQAAICDTNLEET